MKKLNGTNFPFWKQQIMQVLVQRKQVKPLKLKGERPEGMAEDEWEELDELACSTIMLTLAKNVYFNMAKETKFCFSDLRTQEIGGFEDEGTAMSNHLNEFHTIFSQLTAQEIVFPVSVKAMFLLITLPDSCITFRTALSNYVAPEGLTSVNVKGSLLTEEVNRKKIDKGKGNSALVVQGRQQFKEKRDKKSQNKSKSRDSKSNDDIEFDAPGPHALVLAIAVSLYLRSSIGSSEVIMRLQLS
ncbi:hypothetical protein L7F22_039910 [Adiantum nelumboides]|nr:hypothetical protein [Adiantum nelumboides]